MKYLLVPVLMKNPLAGTRHLWVLINALECMFLMIPSIRTHGKILELFFAD